MDKFKVFFDKIYIENPTFKKDYTLSSLINPNIKYNSKADNRTRYLITFSDEDKKVITAIQESRQHKKNYILSNMKKLSEKIDKGIKARSEISNFEEATRSYWKNLSEFIVKKNDVSRNTLNIDKNDPNYMNEEKRTVT